MIKPSENELKILQILWDKGPSSVRDVHEKISENKDSGYTTTLKLMQIMVNKGLADRDTTSRTHIYAAAISEQVTKTDLLSRFISATFKGSSSSLVLQALGNGKTTQEELDEIKALISSIEKTNKK
ncbi:MAG: BlaI/MecI/CopY family transcriptional regulator [Saprospiraceae bacterium]|nr:BlaI/MecI/CopY family transcriptional regulator [Saprospiraceae bacterium]